jgi:hypothetical protein
MEHFDVTFSPSSRFFSLSVTDLPSSSSSKVKEQSEGQSREERIFTPAYCI